MMNIMQDKKRKKDPGTDTGPRKHKTPSPASSLVPSDSASPFRGSLVRTNLSRPPRSPSSLLPAYGANSVGPLSSSVLQSRMAARSMASTAGSGPLSMISSTAERFPSPNDGSSYQAEANVDSPFLSSESSYSQTFRAYPSSPEYNFFLDPPSPHNLHAQGEAIEHFQLGVIAPDIQDDSTAALPVGWTGRDSTMIDPTLYEAQYSTIGFDNGSENSNGIQIALPQPQPSVPSYPAPCMLPHVPRDNGETPVKIYKTSEDFLPHLWEVHMDSSDWQKRECLFAQCSSHAKHTTFSKVKDWLSHVQIVHYPRFYCQHPDCKYRLGGFSPKPFGSQSVLNRHRLTHGPPVYCDKPGCTGKDNIARRDKYTKHQVEYHGTFLCLQPACTRARHVNGVSYGYSTAKDLEKHERISHGDREIASGYDATSQVI